MTENNSDFIIKKSDFSISEDFMKKTKWCAMAVFIASMIFNFSGCPATAPEVPTVPDTQENEKTGDKNPDGNSVPEKKYEINLSVFSIWDKTLGDTFNPSTGKLILKEGWGGGSIWIGGNYTGEYNYVELKYKNPASQFILEVEYTDKSLSKIMCKKDANVAYIKLEPKKINDIKIRKKQSTEWSAVLESVALVQKQSVVDNIKKEPVVDKKTGNFDSSISGIDLVKQMKVGWGLGNSLEMSIVFAGWSDGKDDLDFLRSLGTETEIYWENPYITRELINFPKSQGYSSIRIPVTWYNHIIDDNYTIDPKWMARVKEIVDWSMEAGYYVILNCHHDTEENITSPLKRTNGYITNSNTADIAESKRFLSAIWTQISAAFNGSYDEHLIFEVMNEPRNVDHEHQWEPGVKLAWVDNSKCEECIADYKTLNEFNQLCLDTIRASGGNNSQRFVLLPSLCAGKETALSDYFKLPKDTTNNKLIISVHDYAMGATLDFYEKTFTQQIQQNLANSFSQLNEKFVKNGIPVIVGETSAFRILTPKTERIKWITYFSKLTSSYGMPLLYWDAPPLGGCDAYFDQIDRVNLKFYEPDFVQAMLDNWIAGEKNEPVNEKNGKVDLSKLSEYNAKVQGLVAEFNSPISNYETVFKYKISDLGIAADDGFKSMSVVGKVYNGNDVYDFESDWLARLFLQIGNEKQYNAGVPDMSIPFTSVNDEVEIHIKAVPVTKIIITEITFHK